MTINCIVVGSLSFGCDFEEFFLAFLAELLVPTGAQGGNIVAIAPITSKELKLSAVPAR